MRKTFKFYRRLEDRLSDTDYKVHPSHLTKMERERAYRHICFCWEAFMDVVDTEGADNIEVVVTDKSISAQSFPFKVLPHNFYSGGHSQIVIPNGNEVDTYGLLSPMFHWLTRNELVRKDLYATVYIT